MNILKISRFYLPILLYGLLTSCIDQKDYTLNSIDVNPSVSIPLTYGSVSINDFLNSADSSYIKSDKDGLLSLVYSQQLISQDIRGLFLIPDVTTIPTIALTALAVPSVPQDIVLGSLSTSVDLNLSPEKLSEISFKSGQLLFSTSISPTNNLNYEIIATFPDLVSKTTNTALTIQGKGPFTIKLSDYIAKLNSNKLSVNISFVLKATTTSVIISNNTHVNIQLSLTGMDFTYIKGFMGQQNVSIPSSSLKIGAYGNSLNKASLTLAQPTVNILIANDYGIPVVFSYDVFDVRKTGSSPLSLVLNPANPISLNYPTTLGASASTTIGVTNVNDVINYAPTQFYYKTSAIINKGLTSGNNFLADTSKIRATLNVNIPLIGKASGIVLTDTSSIDLSSVDQSQVAQASLKVKITNQIPLDGVVQFYLTDQNYVILDQLLTTAQTSLLKGSSVDSSGDLLAAGVSDQTLPLDQTKLSKLFTAKHIIVTVTMSTSKDANGNSVNVKFRTQYKMTIESGISATLNINVKL